MFGGFSGKKGLLEQVGASTFEAQRLRVEPLGLRLAVGHLSFGSAVERGMEADAIFLSPKLIHVTPDIAPYKKDV